MRLLCDRVRAARHGRSRGTTTGTKFRDAEYLAIARLQADALVTVDAGLATKAERVTRVGSNQDLVRAD